jgi:hypothetical protein
VDVHHVGQLLDTPYHPAVAVYEELGLTLRETTDGPVRVVSFENPSVEFPSLSARRAAR